MKLVKTASGKQTIKISKSEWESIGKKQGWMSKKAMWPFGNKGEQSTEQPTEQPTKQSTDQPTEQQPLPINFNTSKLLRS